jgi:peptidoglycan/LPS O-acetylase OafA/YrhL
MKLSIMSVLAVLCVIAALACVHLSQWNRWPYVALTWALAGVVFAILAPRHHEH